MKNQSTKKLVLAALFLALAYLLPFLTGQIPEIGSMLLPMHLPVLICGFVCGWPYGLAVGFAAPLLRSFTLGMPPPFPTAVAMAFELAAYGVITGTVSYTHLRHSFTSSRLSPWSRCSATGTAAFLAAAAAIPAKQAGGR